MTTAIIILSMVTWILFDLIMRSEGEITIAPIKGVMVGALYNSEEFENNETEHIVQILFFIFSFNFVWITNK
jgi:ammonia channel protein AmtB